METYAIIPQALILFLFYLIILLFFMAFYFSIIADENSNLILKIFLSPIFLLSGILSIICQTKSMLENNNVIDNKEFYLLNSGRDLKTTFCEKCRIDRPERAHHCSICNKCILKMDHHCPWILNCVGQKNQKSFCLLLFYGFIANLIVFIITFPEFLNSFKRNLADNTIIEFPFIFQISAGTVNLIMMLSFCISFAIIIVLLIIIFNQICNIKYGMTSVEFRIFADMKTCPYFNDNFKENFIELFGNNIFYWFLPFEFKEKIINGSENCINGIEEQYNLL